MSIILGTAQFGLDYGITNQLGKVSFNQVCDILTYAHQQKITTLDTSTQYGDAEQIIGQATKTLGTQFTIITKTRAFNNVQNSPSLLWKDFGNSIKKLGQNPISALLFHSADDLLSSQADQLYQSAIEIKRQYGSLKIGVSVYTPCELNTIIKRYPMDLVQLPLNIFDQRFIEWLPDLASKNIEVHARSIFLQGVLLNQMQDTSFYRQFQNYFNQYQHILDQTHVSRLAFCLYFSQFYAKNIVLGVASKNNLWEIIQNINNADLNKSIVSELRQKFKAMPMALIDPRKWL